MMAEPSDSITNSHYTKDEKLWFSDGNIILLSSEPNSFGFRVHRGFLAVNTEFFKDVGQDVAEMKLADSAEELRDFLYAL